MSVLCANLDRAPLSGLPRAAAVSRRSQVLRAALLALRDWMTAAEVVELARRLPDGWVPVLFEGWRPQSMVLSYPTRRKFIAAVQGHLDRMDDPVQVAEVAAAVEELAAVLPDRLFVRKPGCNRTTRTGTAR